MGSAVGIRKEKSVWNLAYPQWFWSDDNVGVFSRGNNMLIATTNVGSNNDISKLIPLPGFPSGLKYCDVFDSNYCTHTHAATHTNTHTQRERERERERESSHT